MTTTRVYPIMDIGPGNFQIYNDIGALDQAILTYGSDNRPQPTTQSNGRTIHRDYIGVEVDADMKVGSIAKDLGTVIGDLVNQGTPKDKIFLEQVQLGLSQLGYNASVSRRTFTD